MECLSFRRLEALDDVDQPSDHVIDWYEIETCLRGRG